MVFKQSVTLFVFLAFCATGCVKDNRALDDYADQTAADGAMTSGAGDGGFFELDGASEANDAEAMLSDGGLDQSVESDMADARTDMGTDAVDAGMVEPVNDRDRDGVPDEIDNCPDLSNADQKDDDENGVGDLCELVPEADDDQDGIPNQDDNCPLVANNSQTDDDEDGIGNRCDNCPAVANADQADTDGNGQGDVCADRDGDGVLDQMDNCPNSANEGQVDSDDDGVGDTCDNCVNVSNSNQIDVNGNGVGDACEVDPVDDLDLDGIADGMDNCPQTPNRDQQDGDEDGVGDLCDNCPETPNADQDPVGALIGTACIEMGDRDGDGVMDAQDNCIDVPNGNQSDFDDDGVGDRCDNCRDVANFNQADSDLDGFGDACDELSPQLIVELNWGIEDVDFDLHMVGPYGSFGGQGDCWSRNRRFDWCDPGYQFDYPAEGGDRPYEQIRAGQPEAGLYTVGVDRFPNGFDLLAAARLTITCGDNMPIGFGPYSFGASTDANRVFLEALHINPETCEIDELARFTTIEEAGGVCAPENCPAGASCDPETGECIDLCSMVTCDAGLLCDPTSGECIETPVSDWGDGTWGDAAYCQNDSDCEFTEVCYRVPNTLSQVCGIPCGQEGDLTCPTGFRCCDYRRSADYCVPDGGSLGQNFGCRDW